MDRLIYFASGEYWLKRRPNGGTVVFMRSTQLTLLLYAPLAFLIYFSANEITGHFSLKAFAKAIADTIPMLGAIFAASYVTFYSRFSAQWNYLASLYNQIMAASVALSAEQCESSEKLALWKAAFIEDAQDLHLARKPMFQYLVQALLSDPKVRQAFITSCPNGAERVAEIDQALTALPESEEEVMR